jgi:hypothetical protein
MWYYVVRNAFVIALIVAVVLTWKALRKSSVAHKKAIIAFISFAVLLLCAFLTAVPFENIFITFPTIESAYLYKNAGEAQIILNGLESSFIWFRNDKSDYHMAYRKVKDGYKLIMECFDLQKAATLYIGNPNKRGMHTIIEIYWLKDTSDYYSVIYSDAYGNITSISDNQGSEFRRISIHPKANPNEPIVEYCAHIHKPDKDYAVMVNGNVYNRNDFTWFFESGETGA